MELPMAALSIRFSDASRSPLPDRVDVTVTRVRTNADVVRRRDVEGRKKLRVTGLTPLEPYLVRAFPVRHRPVGQFVIAPAGDKAEDVQLFCPVDPQRVADVQFPEYTEVDASLRGVLERSTLERDAGLPPLPAPSGTAGESLYESLTRLERAGLLNLFCKMSHVPLGDMSTWGYVRDVYRVRGDRIFANVAIECRDRVKNAAAGGGFEEVDGSLHHPPPGFAPAGSFKTRDHYGNLQLTFFASTTAPLQFKVDADIDDAAGIEHAFQVLDHWLTHGETHPFDIHEILTFYQRLNPGYQLLV
jgi:hypothetical protein